MTAEASPRWRRIRVALPDTDPWKLLAPLQADGARLMAWSAPGGDQRFVAVGALAESRPTGPCRFEEASAWWQRFQGTNTLTTDWDGRPVASRAPLCLAGFAFRSDAARSREWAAWGDGALCVPEIVIWRDDQGSEATFIVDTETPDWRNTLASLHDQLKTWMARASEAHIKPAEGASSLENGEAQRQWCDDVISAQAQMAKGQLQKVVLARSKAFKPASAQQFDPLGTATALRDRQTRSTTFLIRRRDGQAFLGSSPEVLVKLADGQVNTVALAGTRRRGAGPEDSALGEALLESAKDQTEHALVAAAIVDALEPYVSKVTLPEMPDLVCHPDVQHLRTGITARLKPGSTIFDLVAALHPTPAVGGLPREQAMDWLSDNEALDRGWYAGPIGWISASGEGEFVVAIRSVLMAPNTAAAFAGCGLIADSVPEDEWEESQLKLQTVRQGLAVEPRVSADR